MSQSKERHAEYVLQQYHSRRTNTIEKLGGKCVVCGTTDNLELDHIDPDTKSFAIGKLWSVNKDTYEKELTKCQLLCTIHHRDKTAKEKAVEHGEGKWGKRHCPCELCRAKKKQAQKAYDATHIRKRDRH